MTTTMVGDTYTCMDIGYIKNTEIWKIFDALIKYKNIDGIVATYSLNLHDDCITSFNDLMYDIEPLSIIKIGKSSVKSNIYDQKNPLIINPMVKYQIIDPVDMKTITCKVVFLKTCCRLALINKRSKL